MENEKKITCHQMYNVESEMRENEGNLIHFELYEQQVFIYFPQVFWLCSLPIIFNIAFLQTIFHDDDEVNSRQNF